MSNKEYKKYKESSKDSRQAHSIGKKKLHQMSNDELKKLNYRQSLEYQYKQNNKSRAQKIIIGIGATAAAIGAINLLYKNSKTFINNRKSLISKGKEITNKINNKIGTSYIKTGKNRIFKLNNLTRTIKSKNGKISLGGKAYREVKRTSEIIPLENVIKRNTKRVLRKGAIASRKLLNKL